MNNQLSFIGKRSSLNIGVEHSPIFHIVDVQINAQFQALRLLFEKCYLGRRVPSRNSKPMFHRPPEPFHKDKYYEGLTSDPVLYEEIGLISVIEWLLLTRLGHKRPSIHAMRLDLDSCVF